MLTIHFTSEDIARTRLAPGPDFLWEAVLSMHILMGKQGKGIFSPWRSAATAQLRKSSILADLQLILALNPATGYFPDFLTPEAGVRGLDAGLEAVAATAPEVLRHDLARLAADRPVPAEAHALASGDAATVRLLTDTLRAYHDIALAPRWSEIEAVVEADRIRRIRALAKRGAEGLWESLRPLMRWDAGELRVDYPEDQELHLAGRGLVLIPSYFCWRYPVTLFNPDLPPVLVYPAQRPRSVPQQSGGTHNPLAALLGGTRAAILAAVGEGCSTTELARRAGVSLASASQHASVLRNAGLIISVRERNTVLHMLTPLGLAVIDGECSIDSAARADSINR